MLVNLMLLWKHNILSLLLVRAAQYPSRYNRDSHSGTSHPQAIFIGDVVIALQRGIDSLQTMQDRVYARLNKARLCNLVICEKGLLTTCPLRLNGWSLRNEFELGRMLGWGPIATRCRDLHNIDICTAIGLSPVAGEGNEATVATDGRLY